MTPVIEPLTHDHLVQWYGERGRTLTVKGIAGFVGGSLVAVAGFMIAGGRVIVFCDLKPEARAFKVTIHRIALQLLDEARQRHKRILAVCDGSEPSATAWLRRLGFKHEEGEMWAWQVSR